MWEDFQLFVKHETQGFHSKGDFDYADMSGVIVEGGRRFEADVIIYATGYTFKFPYLSPQSIIPIKVGETNVH